MDSSEKLIMESGMTKLERRACDALHQAFCRLRYFGGRRLNEEGRNYVFLVADAAHNIPDALAGNLYHRDTLEHDVAALEALLEEPYGIACSKYLDRTAERVPMIKRIRLALGF